MKQTLTPFSWKPYSDEADHYSYVRCLSLGTLYEVLRVTHDKQGQQAEFVHQVIFMAEYDETALSEILQGFGYKDLDAFVCEVNHADVDPAGFIIRPDGSIDRKASSGWWIDYMLLASLMAEHLTGRTMPSDSKGGCTLEYSQVLEVSNEELGVIERYLNATREEDYQNEDNTITHTARFPDGMQMDIKCCGSQDGPSWTEAVLFDQNGCQLTYTEVCEHYMGAWELEYNGIKYSAYVTNTGNVLHLHPIQSGLIDREGICPVCGAEVNYCDSHEMTDDGGLIPWECPSCGATGKEGYDRVFDQHYDVQTGEGKPLHSET